MTIKITEKPISDDVNELDIKNGTIAQETKTKKKIIPNNSFLLKFIS
jgi:hypothetical protein